MKWLVWLFISVLVLALFGVGGYVVYQTAYVTGEMAGYDSGYQTAYPIGQEVGHEEGYSSGKVDGYTEGYTSGRDTGYEEGYSSGEAEGYDEGYASGKSDGYKEGIEAGAGHGYALRDPTYQEAVDFLKEDKTDKNEYIEGTYGVYVCSHFARDVCNAAEEQWLRCAYVELRYIDGGHAIIAFDTIDEGMVFFSPQSDEIVKPVIGKEFYKCIQAKPGYYYEAPSYDDTIMDILVIW